MRQNTRLAITVVMVAVLVIGALAISLRLLFPPKDTRFEGIPTIYPYVNDEADALSYDYYASIDDMCYQIDYQTSCEVAILVVNTTQPNDINYFALRVFEKNAIGKEGKDNGVLIVVAVSDETWRIEVGYGLMGILTGARVAAIADAYLVPYIENGSLDDGLYDTTYEIGTILINEYTGESTGKTAYPIGWLPLTTMQWILVIVVVIGLGIVTRGRIFIPLLWVISLFSGGRGKFGGGRSGGGGARGGL
jgi:uncharacterized protein